MHAPAHRGLSGPSREIRAGPAFGIVAVDDGKAQHVGHAPFRKRGARIADHANPPQDAIFVKQHREDHRMTGDARHVWEHSIPPVAELRYSITFRTMAGERRP